MDENTKHRILRNSQNLTEGSEFFLTEHGHVLPGVEVPVAPVGPVAMQGCILLMIVSWLRPKGVNHSDMTSAKTADSHFKTKCS